jgi:hypothetical protein
LKIIFLVHFHTWQSLLNLGARKFGILSVPPVGCVPILRGTTSDGQCINELNVIAQFFFVSLNGVLQDLNAEFPDMKYSLGNTFAIIDSMTVNPPFRKFLPLISQK